MASLKSDDNREMSSRAHARMSKFNSQSRPSSSRPGFLRSLLFVLMRERSIANTDLILSINFHVAWPVLNYFIQNSFFFLL